MRHKDEDLPEWKFTVDEVAPDSWSVKAVRDGGISGEANGVDPDEALADMKAWAGRVEDQLRARLGDSASP